MRRRLSSVLCTVLVGLSLVVTSAPSQAAVVHAAAAGAHRVSSKKYVVPAKYTHSKDDRWGHGEVVAFDSPDHRIQCFIAAGEDSGMYGCAVQSHSWKWPKRALAHCTSKRYVGIEAYTVEDAPMNLMCSSSRIIPRERTPKSKATRGSQVNRVLPLRSTLKYNGTTCESYRYGGLPTIRCTDSISQGGFQLSTKSATFFGSLFGA